MRTVRCPTLQLQHQHTNPAAVASSVSIVEVIRFTGVYRPMHAPCQREAVFPKPTAVSRPPPPSNASCTAQPLLTPKRKKRHQESNSDWSPQRTGRGAPERRAASIGRRRMCWRFAPTPLSCMPRGQRKISSGTPKRRWTYKVCIPFRYVGTVLYMP